MTDKNEKMQSYILERIKANFFDPDYKLDEFWNPSFKHPMIVSESPEYKAKKQELAVQVISYGIEFD